MTTALSRLLRPLVGDDALLPPERWAVHGVVPGAAVAPADAEAVAAVLALASAEGWAVEVVGNATRTGWGRPPARVDVVVSTRRMDGVERYEPEDLTATVGAGFMLKAAARRFAEHRQWLAVDTPTAEGTVGATVALGSAGPLRLGYGTPRDQVLGLRLVTGDGRVLDVGGQVVKNVAGYDLTRLAAGSHGTLGVIARVHVRLRGIPAADRTTVMGAPEPGVLVDAVAALREARLEPAAVELLSPETARGVGAGEEWLLLARWQGIAEDVEHALGVVATTLPGARALTPEAAAAVWGALRSMEAHAVVEARLASLPNRLGATLALALSLPQARGAALAAHAGEGVVRVWAGAGAVAEPESWARSLAVARAELDAERGTLIVSRATPALAEALDPWGAPGATAPLMRGLRGIFDPAGVLCAGRFVV